MALVARLSTLNQDESGIPLSDGVLALLELSLVPLAYRDMLDRKPVGQINRKGMDI